VSRRVKRSSVELFSVRAELQPGNRHLTLRVTESDGGLTIEESAPRKQSKAKVTGAAAESLRARVSALRISQSDIENLAARRVVTRGPSGEELIVLAPFDGVHYRFTIKSADGERSVSVSNPESDLHFKGPFEEVERLKELMALFRHVSLLARGENRANKAPEPTTFAVTSRAIERLTEGRARSVRPIVARDAPAKVVAHL
jgi:hypothetical protein